MIPDWFVWLAAAFLGAAIGSFLNVCILRWPAEESVVKPPSRCPGCGSTLAWYDNIPVVSWVILQARCRRCGRPISIQYPLIELATAVIWLGAAIRFGPSIEAASSAVFLTLLLGIAMTDAQHMVIPDQFSLGGALLGLAFAAAPGEPTLVSALIGGLGSYVLLWGTKLAAEKALGKPALGTGDIHMMAMIGAFLGMGGALVALLAGCLLGLLIGVPILWLRGGLERMGSYMPLGVFLALGAAAAHAWGDALIGWYFATFII